MVQHLRLPGNGPVLACYDNAHGRTYSGGCGLYVDRHIDVVDSLSCTRKVKSVEYVDHRICFPRYSSEGGGYSCLC